MAVYFFDSSAVVKRYVQEKGTAWVTSVLGPGVGNTIYIARITGAEGVAAIGRRARRGDLTTDDAINAIAQFRGEFAIDCQKKILANQPISFSDDHDHKTSFCRPSGAWVVGGRRVPGLTPWATVYRPSGARSWPPRDRHQSRDPKSFS